MDWEFKYCKFYCIVLHIMLFLIDFLKKDVNFFSFFLVYFHTVCVLYMCGDLCPPSLTPVDHDDAFLKRR